MKAKHFFLIIAGLIFWAGCSKDRLKKNDYRNQWVGKYQVVETVDSYGPCWDRHTRKDTVISVTYGNSDSTLFVLGREVKLNEEGFYGAYHYALRIWNDSIWSYFMNGGLGCGDHIKHEGYRISEKP